MKVFVLIFIAGLSSVSAYAGNGSSGGGDAVKQDFIIAANQAFRVLNKSGSTLTPAVDALSFNAEIDPAHIESTDATLTYQGTVVDAFYDASSDMIQINRARWQDIQKEDEKVRLAAHEIFRRMGVSDDSYQTSSQIQILYDALFDFSKVLVGDYVPADKISLPKTCWIHLEKHAADSSLTIAFNKQDPNDGDCDRELLGWAGSVFNPVCDPQYGTDCIDKVVEEVDPLLGKFIYYAALTFDDSYNFTLSALRVSLEQPPATLPPNTDACYFSICSWNVEFLRKD
jgi:hypothetical protein